VIGFQTHSNFTSQTSQPTDDNNDDDDVIRETAELRKRVLDGREREADMRDQIGFLQADNRHLHTVVCVLFC